MKVNTSMETIKRHRFLLVGASLLLGALLVVATVRALPAGAQSSPGNPSQGNQGTNHKDCSGGSGGMMGGSGSNGMGSMMGNVDRHFIEQMIPHHENAVAMADMALQKAQRPEIKTLAANIKRTQTAEIVQMRTWYKQWYGADIPATNTNSNTNQGMMGGSGGMMGMGMGRGMSMDTSMDDLAKAADFDKAFIEAMIPHHQMALMMSNMVLAHGEKAELNNLAQSIITSQSAEIEQMQTWYKQWYGTTP